MKRILLLATAALGAAFLMGGNSGAASVTKLSDQRLFNTPAVVEHQPATYAPTCGNDPYLFGHTEQDCVINPSVNDAQEDKCVWDPDDDFNIVHQGSLGVGESFMFTVCLYADWTTHLISMEVRAGSRDTFSAEIAFRDFGHPYESVVIGQESVGRGCMTSPDYDSQDPLPDVPIDPQLGGQQGRAEHYRINFQIINRGTRTIRDFSMSSRITIDSSTTVTQYCGAQYFPMAPINPNVGCTPGTGYAPMVCWTP